MIYLVSSNQELFDDSDYKHISVEESLDIIKSWNLVQFDTETSGRDAHIDKLLCAQFGNKTAGIQIVVDCVTTDIRLYKDVLESKLVIGQNLKFDLQFLYNYGIVPLNVYDTMIVEQLLYLGYPSGQISFSLKEIAWRRLGINIDKTVRGEIIWRGLDKQVILYAAGDVTPLEDIMWSQVKDCRERQCMVGAKLECDFVPAIAYLEWCGIHLDEKKWKEKMVKDKENLNSAINELNKFVVDTPSLSKFTYIDRQGDLFSGFNLEPQVTLNWSSSKQVIEVAKILGFNTQVKDKETGEDKDSVLEKHLASQKGVNDEFLKLYFNYQEYAKVCSSFGQGHLNAVNPKTNRIHTVYKQLGAASGRMSCGSRQSNTSLAKLNQVPQKNCTYPNMQQLPADEQTRGAFTAPEGYEWCSCDFSALESRLGADIYNEKHMIDEFLHGSGDIHSLMALTFFEELMEEGTTTKDVKKKYPELRKKAKSPEFLIQFGGSAFGLATQLAISQEEAQKYVDSYYNKFKGIADFKEKGSKFVRKNGYVLMCKVTGHKMYWWDHKDWLEMQKTFNSPGFWDDYKLHHKGTGDKIAQEVSMHSKIASKWDRMALNAPTQGTGCIILKTAVTNFFKWIVENGYFGVVELSALVHDEANIIYPTTLHDVVPDKLKSCMEDAAAIYCKSLPIPADASVGSHWIH